jgi:hypothetical protein
MPSARHEAANFALHSRPQLLLDLLDAVGVTLAGHDRLLVDSADLSDLVPTEFRCDGVVTAWAGDTAVESVGVEFQLRFDEDKPFVWPAYLGNLRAKRRCPVRLVVFCTSTRTADRCAEPIETGHPGYVLRPIVFGPREIPRVVHAEEARAKPGLTVLSALSHPRDRRVLTVLPEALLPVAPGMFEDYHRLVEAALPAAARRFVEGLMVTDTRFKSAFANKHHDAGVAEGRAEGLAEGLAEGALALVDVVLGLLDERKVRVTDSAKRTITTCRDLAQLRIWAVRAGSVNTVDELFTPAR